MKTWIIALIIVAIVVVVILGVNYYKKKNPSFDINNWTMYNKCVEDNKKLPIGADCKSCAPNGVGDFNGKIDSTGRCIIK